MMDVLRRWDQLASLCMAFLRQSVRFVLVIIPEALALKQLEYVFRELARYELQVEQLIVNNVITTTDSPFLAQKAAQQQEHLRQLRQSYGQLPITEIPLFPQEIQGLARLHQVAAVLGPVCSTPLPREHNAKCARHLPPGFHGF